jgi:hypothetical protein
MGAGHSQGYGVYGTRREFAHRYAYALANGPIPDGLCVLHRCDVRLCVNPEHLFLGTRPENTADMVRKGRQRVMPKGWGWSADPCPQGHDFNSENFRIGASGRRVCRVCERASNKRNIIARRRANGWYRRPRS